MHDAFTLSSSPVVSDIKDRVESLLLYGDKLFIGCSNGSLHIYTLNTRDGVASATRDKVIKQFSKKSIEQLAAIKETNSLVSLSDGIVYLHDLQTYEQQTVLGSSSQTKGQANIFALETSIQTTGQLARAGKGKEREKNQASPVSAKRRGKGREVVQDDPAEQEGVPVVVTTLAVGCRRRLILFTWRDGQWQEPREVSLPHQIRSLAFPLPQSLILGFSTGDYGTASLPWVTDASSSKQPTLSEIFTPSFPAPTANTSANSGVGGVSSHTLGAIPGMGTLGGLAAKTGGIMGLGGKVDKNIVVKVKSGEVLVMKDNIAVLLDSAGKPSRPTSIEYALPPEETVTSWPYLLSLLPAPAAMGNLSKQQTQDPLTALPTIHVHSIPDLTPTQAIRVPRFEEKEGSGRPISIIDVPPPPTTQAARLLTTGPNGKSPMAVITHPLAESSSSSSGGETKIYLLSATPWAEQLDSLVSSGSYEEALSLLASLDNPQHSLPDADARKKRLRTLAGLSLFLHRKKYEQAIDIFIEENVNPAKVVALFPKAISGKLFLDKEMVEQVWGGRTREQVIESEQMPGTKSGKRPERKRQETMESVIAEEVGNEGDGKGLSTSPAVSSSWRFSPAKKKDDDTASIKSMRSKKSHPLLGGRDRESSSAGQTINRDAQDDLSYKLSVDVLMRYLPDRRQQFLRALAALPPNIRPSPTTPLPSSPSNTPSDLFSLPDEPLSTYTAAQLQRTAQVVETALFKCYLHAKPGLLGPLCRIENWCEVEEVEELLLEAKKYRELLDLYNGKQKHEKAIKLLQRMADEPEDKPLDEKVDPIVLYLQKLGSKHLDLIFSASQWVFTLSPSAGLEVFTADMEEVETLPRHAVSLHLQKTAKPQFYAKYLEHIIFHLHEGGPEFHERLAEIYLDEVETLSKQSPDKQEDSKKAYAKLIDFLETSTQYRPGRLLGRIPDGQMYEVRAILLGRLGQHDGALQIYVYKLGDHVRAEEYCKRVYDAADPANNDIFLTLLKVYLRPRRDSDYVPAKSTPTKPLFTPALSLLATQGTKMDTAAVLDLLPPLLTVKDLQVFLQKSVRRSVQTKNARKVEKKVWRARQDQVERTLVDLEGRRVKITDGRLCPQCHKRLGNSVIAIHSPRGEVTHYQCRDRWIEAKMQAGY